MQKEESRHPVDDGRQRRGGSVGCGGSVRVRVRVARAWNEAAQCRGALAMPSRFRRIGAAVSGGRAPECRTSLHARRPLQSAMPPGRLRNSHLLSGDRAASVWRPHECSQPISRGSCSGVTRAVGPPRAKGLATSRMHSGNLTRVVLGPDRCGRVTARQGSADFALAVGQPRGKGPLTSRMRCATTAKWSLTSRAQSMTGSGGVDAWTGDILRSPSVRSADRSRGVGMTSRWVTPSQRSGRRPAS